MVVGSTPRIVVGLPEILGEIGPIPSKTPICNAIEFREITQNKGYYATRGHSRSPMSVPIESPYATSY